MYTKPSFPVVLLSILIFPLPTFASSDYYINSSGVKVHVPVQTTNAPATATAQCKDGSYSYSLHKRGTCNGHRGVKKWLKTVPR